MKDEDKKIFFNCLIGAAEVTGKELSKVGMRLYWESLKHLEINVVVDAFNRHIVNPDNGQFMPKPADIIKLTTGSHLDSAMIAWSKVDKAIRSVGSYESVVFDDSVIMATICDMGGWIDLCKSTETELKFKINEFNTRYKSYKNMSSFSYPKKLIGISESYNRSEGQKIKDPILIGDSEKALLTYKSGGDSSAIGTISMSEVANKLVKKIE